MDEIYRDGKYKQANPTWHEEDAPWKARQIRAILADNEVRFQSACEVGCGAGEVLIQLSRMFPEIKFSGYDISPQAIEIASRKNCPQVSFHLEDPLQRADMHFDVVLVIDVIEHIEDYIGFLKKLRKFGRLKVLHIPLDLSVQSLARMWPILRLRRNVGHIHYFSRETAEAALIDCGYRIIDRRYTASRLELPNQALSSRMIASLRGWLHSVTPDLTVRVLGGYSLLVLAE